jgi:F420-dependent oxidoreductase-like protein
MDRKRIGIAIGGTRVAEIQTAIEEAEQLGIQAAWMPTSGAQLDNITTLAAVAARTRNIMLGTSIVPTYPRHPLVMAQQVQVLAQLAPGRFRLGIGPSHRSLMRPMGINLQRPLGNTREYLRILKGLLQEGKVDFDGEFYQAHETIPEPLDLPVMAAALQRGSFELCGAEADGAITWICPKDYLRDVALPAMKKGAEEAGRPVPPLIAHAPVCLHDNPDEVRAAFREEYSSYIELPFYRRMLVAAGYPEASERAWSDAMIEGLLIHGEESLIADRLRELLSMGATEILVSPVLVGDNQPASLDRTLRLLGQVAQSLV